MNHLTSVLEARAGLHFCFMLYALVPPCLSTDVGPKTCLTHCHIPKRSRRFFSRVEFLRRCIGLFHLRRSTASTTTATETMWFTRWIRQSLPSLRGSSPTQTILWICGCVGRSRVLRHSLRSISHSHACSWRQS